MDAGYEIFLAVGGTGDEEIFVAEASVAETSGHGFGGGGYVADGIGGVDLDQLFEDFTGEWIGRNLLLRTACQRNGNDNRRQASAQFSV